MMQANELRLENLVWNETQKIPVKVNMKILAEQHYRYKIYKKTGKNLGLWEPIPLTEEWFLNHEFEHNIEQEIFNRYDICLSYSDKYKGFKLYVNHEYEIGKPMLYLHQFQNLYFDLEHKKFNT